MEMNKLTLKELRLLHNLVSDDLEIGKEDNCIESWSDKIVYQLESVKRKLENKIKEEEAK